MKTISVFALLIAFAGSSFADVPKKIPRSRYEALWKNSPFTSKPAVETGAPVENPLSDFALIGVSSTGDNRYRVTMINKKAPEDERIYVDSDNPKAAYKIIKVNRTPGDPMGTTVTMSSGTMTGTVSYDEKLLTIAAAKTAGPGPGQNGQPGQPGQPNQPGQPPNGNNNPALMNRPPGAPGANTAGAVPGAKTPRPRIVPPPSATPQATIANPPTANQGGGPPGNQGGGNTRPSHRRNY